MRHNAHSHEASKDPSMNIKSPHPHFDDRGTLSWHRRLEDALAQARAEGKKVFIEFGREL